MFDGLKKKLYFMRRELLFTKGVNAETIVPFEDEIYESMSHTYVGGLPVSIRIKHMNPSEGSGKCFERSLFMFSCFDNAVLVRGNIKELEYNYGKGFSRHGWIEIGDYVYDPSLLIRFDKKVYYAMNKPKNVERYTTSDFRFQVPGKELYDEIRSTKIEDFQPGGERRRQAFFAISLIRDYVGDSIDPEFAKDLQTFQDAIDGDLDLMQQEILAEYETAVAEMTSKQA